MMRQRSLFLWLSGSAAGILFFLWTIKLFPSATIVVDGARSQQLVHGVGCYFSNLSLSPVALQAIFDDLQIRTFRYPMFLQWEQAGGDFSLRDNEDPDQFSWEHYQAMFAKNREVTSLQERPDWFTALRELTQRSERVLISTWTFWQISQEAPHLLELPEGVRNAQIAEDYAAVLLHARDAYGIDQRKIFFSINEPDVEGHNGKILSAEEHHRALTAIVRKFTSEGLEAIQFAPPDVGFGRLAPRYLRPLLTDPEIQPRIAAASYHLYAKGPGNAVAWSNSQGLEAWMTEYWLTKEKIDPYIFAELNSGASWYIAFACDEAVLPDGSRAFGYYTLKHFSRFIDFPSHYLASTGNAPQLLVAAFRQPANGRIGVVIANTGAATTAVVMFRNVPTFTTLYGYQTGAGQWAGFLGPISVEHGKATFSAPADSLTTLVSTPTEGNQAPVAIISFPESQNAPVGTPVTFHGERSVDNDGDPLTYHWRFGDGAFSSEPSPIHRFSQVGSTQVMLTVADDKGAKSAASMLLTIEEPSPTAPPSFTILSPDADQVVDTQAIIRWTDEDPDSDARITWFYDSDNNNFDGVRICSLFYDGFESAALAHWRPWRTPWRIVADPERPGNHVVKPEGVNSYLELTTVFPRDVIVSVRQRGLGGPTVHYSNLLESPAGYRLRGNLLLSKRPGNVTLLQENYPHEDTRWYWRELEAQDRLYGETTGVSIRGEVHNEQHALVHRVRYHDLGSFGYVPATRDRGATGIALYGYGSPGEYFDDVCIDAIAARSEDDEADHFVWDTTRIPAGAYYIYAVVTDGEHTIRRYSPGRVIIRHEPVS